MRLLKHLKENNVPIALATSSDRENYEVKTTRWRDLFELFDHKVIGGSDPEIVHGKPAPDIFLTAAKRFRDNPDPSKVMYFSDSLTLEYFSMQERYHFDRSASIKIYVRLIVRAVFSVWSSRIHRTV